MNKAVFLDKDGTLIVDIPYNVNPALVRLQDGAAQSLKLLKEHGYSLIVVSNQSGVAHGLFDADALLEITERIQAELRVFGVQLDGAYYCPHHPEGSIRKYAVTCWCRKPSPGLILEAASRHNIDLTQSWMIGDILHDVEAGNRAGCRTILINNGHETEWTMNSMRKPSGMASGVGEAASIILRT